VTDPVKIQGLREFRNQLRDLDAGLPKALRLAFNRAAQIVVDEAQPRVPTRTGRARGSVKVRSTRMQARVQGGSRRVPYYPWLDFGGRVGRRRSVSRPFLKEGRYIYRAYFDNREKFVEGLTEALVQVAAEAGLEVTDG
jgi:hypothetical protein